MNPLAVGLIALGIVLLFIGISNLMKNKRTNGIIYLLMGLLAIAVPFVASYLIAR